MYLLDTDVISETRKGSRINPGVKRFLLEADAAGELLFLSVITLGELRRGIELLRHRNDIPQVTPLETWLTILLSEYEERILDFGPDEAQVWGKLRVPHHENPLDKQVAATAITNSLTLVTRNTQHFERIEIRVINPFR